MLFVDISFTLLIFIEMVNLEFFSLSTINILLVKILLMPIRILHRVNILYLLSMFSGVEIVFGISN